MEPEHLFAAVLCHSRQLRRSGYAKCGPDSKWAKRGVGMNVVEEEQRHCHRGAIVTAAELEAALWGTIYLS